MSLFVLYQTIKPNNHGRRNKVIYAMHLAGKSQKVIGNRFNLSGTRIGQIVQRIKYNLKKTVSEFTCLVILHYRG